MALLTPDAIIMNPTSGGLWDWAGASASALTVSATLLAFFYIWATLFRNIQLVAYVKSEVYELFVSAVLAVMVIGAVGALGSLTIGAFIPHDLLPVDKSGNIIPESTNIYTVTAMYYERVSSDMERWLNLNYLVNMYVDQMASVTPYARPLGVGLVASPLAGFASPIKQLLYNMTVALSIAYIINHAQLVVYIFALDAFLKYYLPMGIFFRCFTPTRRLGGTLIGVAVAFLFFFPAISVITYSMLYNNSSGALLTFWTMIESYVKDFTSDGFLGKFTNFFSSNYSIGITDLVSAAFGGIGSLFEAVVGKLFLFFVLMPVAMVSWGFIIGFVIPAINVLLFTQAAKGLSKSFGEEVDVSSLTRMI